VGIAEPLPLLPAVFFLGGTVNPLAGTQSLLLLVPDGAYFEKKNYKMVRGWGSESDPASPSCCGTHRDHSPIGVQSGLPSNRCTAAVKRGCDLSTCWPDPVPLSRRSCTGLQCAAGTTTSKSKACLRQTRRGFSVCISDSP
jgi:hypothetical protein